MRYALSILTALALCASARGQWVTPVVDDPEGPNRRIGSLDLDGSAQYLWHADATALRCGTTSFTFSAWVKLTSTNYGASIISKDDNATTAGSEYLMCYYPPYKAWDFQVEGGTTYFIPCHAFEYGVIDKWMHVLGWWDSVNARCGISVNGLTNFVKTSGALHGTTTPFAVGATMGTSSTGGYAHAQIAAVGMWRRLLTEPEKDSLSTIALSAKTGDPVRSGTAYNCSWSADVPACLSGNTYSLEFNGSSSYVKIKLPRAIQCGNDTTATCNPWGALSLWFKADAFGSMICQLSSGYAQYIRVLDSTHIRLCSSSAYADFTVPTMSTGTWYHLLVTGWASYWNVYLNAVKSTTDGTLLGGDMTFNQFGRYYDGSYGYWFDGKIADVELFADGNLSAANITNLYNNAALTGGPRVSTRWSFSEGSGSTVGEQCQECTAGTAYSDLTAGLKSGLTSWWQLNEAEGAARVDSSGTNTLTDVGSVPLGTALPNK